MKPSLPAPLAEAQKKGIECFMGEACEWKLELESSAPFIADRAGSPVLIFANNGFGDYLFLKQTPDDQTFGETVFEFLHEGPTIEQVTDDLETLLGLKDRPPSTDGYPKAVYATGEPVEPGDRVQIKVWAQFWKGWQDGVVHYVPGMSKKKPQHEYGGLKWVAIRFRDGEICPLVDPETGTLRKVRFLGRGDTKASSVLEEARR
jgi:hypothetical protein